MFATGSTQKKHAANMCTQRALYKHNQKLQQKAHVAIDPWITCLKFLCCDHNTFPARPLNISRSQSPELSSRQAVATIPLLRGLASENEEVWIHSSQNQSTLLIDCLLTDAIMQCILILAWVNSSFLFINLSIERLPSTLPCATKCCVMRWTSMASSSLVDIAKKQKDSTKYGCKQVM